VKNFIKKNLLIIVFSLVGAIGGFLYWKFVGCTKGVCFIKSIWYMSTLYGLIIGYLAGSLTVDLLRNFRKGKKYE